MRDDLEQTRAETLKKVNRAWVRLIDRVNQAADDGYDVIDPADILADALWSVTQSRVAAGRMPLIEECEFFIREYEAQILAIDRQFPARRRGSS